MKFTQRVFGKMKRGIAPIPASPAPPPPPPPPILNALQLDLQGNEAEPVASMPSATVAADEERGDQEVTSPCDWAIDSDGHPNAVYIKSKMQMFVEEVIVKSFPSHMPVWSAEDQILSFSGTKESLDALIVGFLAMVEPDCPSSLNDCLGLLIEQCHKDQDYIEEDFDHGCLFIRTPTCWITSFVDRWEDQSPHHPSDQSSELSFVIGRPDSLNIREIGEQECSSARVPFQGGIYIMDPNHSSEDAPIRYQPHEMVDQWRWYELHGLNRNGYRIRRPSIATI